MHSRVLIIVDRYVGVRRHRSEGRTDSKVVPDERQRYADFLAADVHVPVAFSRTVPITFYGDSIVYAAVGEPMLIPCRVQATPVAEISWFKGHDKARIGSLLSSPELVFDSGLIRNSKSSASERWPAH